MKKAAGWMAALALAAGLLALGVWVMGVRDSGQAMPRVRATPLSMEKIARGEYLARAGNCMFCHTRRGGPVGAGGRPIPTPFGSVYSTNLTPDAATGIGNWDNMDFWRALHHGRSRDGRLLTPAFPYPSTTLVTREDSDAMLAYLKQLPPVVQSRIPHQLRWPYNTQAALAVWRALFFRAGVYRPEPSRSAAWNRGAYLVQGLAHCNACHGARNALGATKNALDLAGAMLPMQNWYAPSLQRPSEAGVAQWQPADIVRLLQTGVAQGASVSGPMADVVFHSTQYLSAADLAAVGSSRVDLQACKLEYSIVSPK